MNDTGDPADRGGSGEEGPGQRADGGAEDAVEDGDGLSVDPVEDAGGTTGAGKGGADGTAGTAGGGEHGVEVPVEAVEDLSPSVDDGVPEYVLYGGKGGVGKTTMAAATGLASAAAGDATLVVSTDPAHSLADTFETPLGPSPTRIAPDSPLYAVEIDPEDALDDAGVFGTGGDLGGLGGLLGGVPGAAGAGGDPGGTGAGGTDAGGAVDGEGAAGKTAAGAGGPLGEDGLGPEALPGADEAAAMQQLLRYLDDERFDRVVVDTAPTGHTLRLLQLPEVLDGLVGTVAQLRDRVSGLFGAVPGVESQEGPDLDEVAARVERLRAVLRDPQRTDFRVVLVPEALSVAESERLLDRLDAFGVPVDTLVVNRVMEPAEDVLAEVGELEADAFVAPNPQGCAFCEQRWAVQRAALADATDLFRGRTVRRVPLFAEEVRGPGMLRAVAACLV